VRYELKTGKLSVKASQHADRKNRQDPSSGELSDEALAQVIGGLLPAIQSTGISSATGGAGAG
jgi:bacteriocin-like protein